jgi:glycosyltransferase involved in cell wall biosynthesis
MPKVSFVVPCYKLAHFLPQCLASIRSQTYLDFDVLVMDDCSPDGTAAAALQFADPRIRHIRNAENLGNIRNYNKGIKLAQGDYIWLISADDYLKSRDVLERYVRLLDSHPRVGYIFSPALGVTDNGSETVIGASSYGSEDVIIPAGDRQYLSALLDNEGYTLLSPTVIVRKSCYQQIGGFPVEFPHRGDTLVWARTAMEWDVAYLAAPMACYRQHGASMLNQVIAKRPELAMKDDIGVLWAVWREAKRLNRPEVALCCERALARNYGRYLSGRWSSGIWAEDGGQITPEDFETELGSAVSDRREHRRIAAASYLMGGDRAHRSGARDLAQRLYARALAASPWQFEVLSKVALTSLGPSGQQVRTLLGRLRSLGRSTGGMQHPSTK